MEKEFNMDEDILPEKSDKEWTQEDLNTAIQSLLKETNTNFETLAKNIENNKELYDFVYRIAIEGEQVFYKKIPIIASIWKPFC